MSVVVCAPQLAISKHISMVFHIPLVYGRERFDYSVLDLRNNFSEENPSTSAFQNRISRYENALKKCTEIDY